MGDITLDLSWFEDHWKYIIVLIIGGLTAFNVGLLIGFLMLVL